MRERYCFSVPRFFARRCAEQVRLPEFVGVRVGFGGCYKAGLWTPSR